MNSGSNIVLGDRIIGVAANLTFGDFESWVLWNWLLSHITNLTLSWWSTCVPELGFAKMTTAGMVLEIARPL